MEFTPKQERNGATGATAAMNSAAHSTGPDATAAIAAAKGGAEANPRWTAETLVVSTTAGVVDWETGVSGHEQPGEA